MSKKEKMPAYSAAVLTISDKGSRGEREDTSGPRLRAMLAAEGFAVSAGKTLCEIGRAHV